MNIQINNICFALNSQMEYVGDPENQSEIDAFNSIKDAHAAMELEFQDAQNIGEFILLLARPTGNAFVDYNFARGRSFE